jgi:hypothetical protein
MYLKNNEYLNRKKQKIYFFKKNKEKYEPSNL